MTGLSPYQLTGKSHLQSHWVVDQFPASPTDDEGGKKNKKKKKKKSSDVAGELPPQPSSPDNKSAGSRSQLPVGAQRDGRAIFYHCVGKKTRSSRRENTGLRNDGACFLFIRH